ncbi:MAG: N-acetyltransferase [Clostridia bacterium]|nr:GNAT family N-acetyltransferase [Lachnospiraceae bacterium]NCB99913.1 N-acetyltransferase [Clostridia bacterium]NCD03062.1 N-acetyltransferase [Clostridia bacterium]
MDFKKDDSGVGVYSEEKEVGRAFCRYSGNQVEILRVEVDDSMRGRGIAGQLVEKVVTEAEGENKEIVPICSYAVKWMSEHR